VRYGGMDRETLMFCKPNKMNVSTDKEFEKCLKDCFGQL
jgi:hypothetical protein